MSAITTHILDVSAGVPAKNVAVTLETQTPDGWKVIGEGVTDEDGRLKNLLSSNEILQSGNYRLNFDTGNYFRARQVESFYPHVTIAFTVFDSSHYHVPLLLSPFGYSTYRGS